MKLQGKLYPVRGDVSYNFFEELLMESRGTGVTPRRPAGWEHGAAINFSGTGPNAAPQGPSKGPAVTMRDLPADGEKRFAQAPIPGEVVTSMEQGGGFLSQIMAGRPGMQAERARPGNDGNVIKAGAGMVGGFPSSGGSNAPTSGSAGGTKGGF